MSECKGGVDMRFPFVLKVAVSAVVGGEVLLRPIRVWNGCPLPLLFGFKSPSSFGVETVTTSGVDLGH